MNELGQMSACDPKRTLALHPLPSYARLILHRVGGGHMAKEKVTRRLIEFGTSIPRPRCAKISIDPIKT